MRGQTTVKTSLILVPQAGGVCGVDHGTRCPMGMDIDDVAIPSHYCYSTGHVYVYKS